MWQHGDMAAHEATMVVHDTVGGHGTQKTAKKTVSKLIRFGTTSGKLISKSKCLVHFFLYKSIQGLTQTQHHVTMLISFSFFHTIALISLSSSPPLLPVVKLINKKFFSFTVTAISFHSSTTNSHHQLCNEDNDNRGLETHLHLEPQVCFSYLFILN